MNKVIIECNKKQAALIEISLDCLSRMCAGQMGELVRGIESMRGKCFPVDDTWWNKHDLFIGGLKKWLFPTLHENASYGVGMKELGDAQIAYEMVKRLQNFRSKNIKDPGVLAHEPLHYSDEPLIKVTEVNETIK